MKEFREAQDLINRALSAKHDRRLEEAKNLLLQAARLHEESFKKAPPENLKARVLLGVQMVALYSGAEDYEEVIRSGHELLDLGIFEEREQQIINGLVEEAEEKLSQST